MEPSRIAVVAGTLLFAVVVWVSVKLSADYQTAVRVPLVLEQIPEGMAVMSPVPESILLRLRGNGWQLLSLVTATELHLPVSIQDHPGRSPRVTTAAASDWLGLPAGLTLTGMEPDSFSVLLDTYTEETLPVALRIPMTFHDGYGPVGPISLSPDTVRVGGAASLLATLDSFRVVTPELTDLRAPIDVEIPFRYSGPYLVNASPRSGRLRIDVQALAEKVVAGIPIEVRNQPPERELILVPPRIDVLVRGGIGRLATLEPGAIRASVLFDDILRDTTGMIPVTTELPEGLTLVSRRPDRIEYIVRKRL